MPGINWSIPLDTNAIPSNINAQIARGPDLSWIGNLPDDYFAGQQAGYQQRNRDLFQDLQGNDFATRLLRAGGAAAIPNLPALGLYQSYQDSKNAGPPPPIPDENAAAPNANAQPMGNFPPSTAPGARVQTTDQSVPPSQVASANPFGVPQPVQRPTATVRAIAQQTGADPKALATAAGVGLDDPLNDQQRAAVVQALRQSPPARFQIAAPCVRIEL